MAGSFASRLGSLLAPPRCAACAHACAPGRLLCEPCAEGLLRSSSLIAAGPSGIELAVSAAEYVGVARAIAHGLKFGRRLGLAAVAADAIRQACPEEALRGEVVPVPPSPLRWRWRGFDPAEEIALALARATALPVSRCLRRSPGPRQVGRTRRQRLADPPRVTVRGPAPREALLVDDVHTTGATLGACAAALRHAGCVRVVALTLARSR